jgi:hypothetical protein
MYRCQVCRCTGVQVFGRDRQLDFDFDPKQDTYKIKTISQEKGM